MGGLDEPDETHRRRTRALAVSQGGNPLGSVYAAGISADTPLLGWSMIRRVLNALVGIGVRQGKFRIENRAPVAEWDGVADPRHAIMFEDLLRMRTGFRFDEAYDDPLSDVSCRLFRECDRAGFAVYASLEVPIGERCRYCSGTSLILARAVQRAPGVSDLALFAQRELFEPVGLRSAVMEADASGSIVASSLMWATARDWLRIGKLLLVDGVWGGGASCRWAGLP